MLNLVANGPSGYTINNSLRFRSSASAYLNRTPASAGNRTVWTWSGWVKLGVFANNPFFAADSSGTAYEYFRVNGSGNIQWGIYTSGTIGSFTTNAVYRDPSAWYHVVIARNGTTNTCYVNGVSQSFSANTTTSSNGYINATNRHTLGANIQDAQYYDGYMAEVNFIDGQALTPSSFGQTSTTTGVWIPKKYTSTYGTNGFYLPFSDTSALTTASNAGLGKDFSGNSNYWVTNNISITAGTTYDAMIDSPTNASSSGTQPVGNYAVMNPLNAISTTGGNTTTLSNANLTVLMPNTSASRTAFATIGATSGKWYWEATVTTGSINTYYPGLGVNTNLNALPTDQSGGDSTGYMYLSNGQKFNSGTLSTYGSSFTTNDVIGVALDMDAGTITFYKNNTSQGQAFSGITGTAVPCVVGQNNAALAINFGQRPFAYTPPSGFKSLCTTNLPTPTILQGNKYMDATLWTGNSSTPRAITNAASFQPDLVWIKCRSTGYNNNINDSVRGANKTLYSNATTAETANNGAGYTSAFNSNGFSVTTGPVDANQVNNNGDTYVGWQWQAGQGSTSSNTSGSITSTVSVNATAGFSIVTYTGTGANATVGHGLGVAPKMIFIKNRTSGSLNWGVYNATVGNTKVLLLNTTAAASAADPSFWNNTSPTSTTFSLSTWPEANNSGNSFVAYCFAAISGYSAFGSYTGNGSTDGAFIYTGFRPKYVMIKRTNLTSSWYIYDSSRNAYNVIGEELYAESSSAAFNRIPAVDFLSNGFKLRCADAGLNANGDTEIYAAFAESPFKNSLAR